MAARRYDSMRLLANSLQQELQRLEDLSFQTDVKDLVFDLLRKRLAGSPIRAFFVQQIYYYTREAMGKSAWNWNAAHHKQFSRQLPFVFEVIITIQYLHNQILDGKAGVTNQSQVAQNLLAGNFLKDLLYEYIEKYFPPKMAGVITCYARRAFKYVDFGQYIEKNWNTYEQFQALDLSAEAPFPEEIEQFIQLDTAGPLVDKLHKELPLEKWAFTKLYLKRIYLTCAALFVLATELILELTNYQGPERNNLRHFSINYGLMRQLVNDNADFIPSTYNLATHSKQPTDAFCDLKNHNLTLPLIFYLSENDNTAIATFLQQQQTQLTPQQEHTFFEALQSSYALHKAIQNNKILGELAISWLNPKLTASAFLTDSCEIVYWNKFLYPCLKTPHYKTYKKTAYYARTKALIGQIRVHNQPQRKASLSLLDMVNKLLLPNLEPAACYFPK